MGIVIETGSGVSLFKKGDRIVMPFNVGDGRCWNCEEVGTAFCTGVNPYGSFPLPYPYVPCQTDTHLQPRASQAVHNGYVAMGPYQGGQARYLRVPYADFTYLTLPHGAEYEADFILLAHVFSTGWYRLVLPGFKPSESGSLNSFVRDLVMPIVSILAAPLQRSVFRCRSS